MTSAEKPQNAPFVTELVKYFRDFLETNFHKRRIPKRNIRYRDEKNLFLGLKLIKYKTFHDQIIDVLAKNDFKNKVIKIKKHKYKTVLPENILDFIYKKIDSLDQNNINKLTNESVKSIESAINIYSNNLESAYVHSLDLIQKSISDIIVNPLLNSIEEPIKEKSSVHTEPIYVWKENLDDIFIESIRGFTSTTINNYFADKSKIDKREFESVWNLKYFKDVLRDFFQNIAIDDFVHEVREIYDNNKILDKKEVYIYFCDIEFNGNKYPIFYIPAILEKYKHGFELRFDTSLYINSKAINYVVEGYNKEKDLHGKIGSIDERILYTQEFEENLLSRVNSILVDICDYFGLDKHLDLMAPEINKAFGNLVRITNNTHLCIFDKSDEALINDYEEMLQLLESDNSLISEKFNNLISSFISEQPKVTIEDINSRWDSLELSDQLIEVCPVPLNEEQRKITIALKNNDTKYITVEGPPGTGKSHTITALIFNAINNRQSILVLSDKKEALDVVENKITDALNNIRPDQNFQNPILRLGKAGNTYNKILSTASVNMIRGNYHAVKKLESKWETDLKDIRKSLSNNITDTVHTIEDFKFDEMIKYGQINKEYIEADKFPIIVDELGESQNSVKDFSSVRQSILEFNEFLEKKEDLFRQILKEYFNDNFDYNNLLFILNTIHKIHESTNHTSGIYESIDLFESFNDNDLEKLSKYISIFGELRSGFFGTLFKRKYVKQANQKFIHDLKYSGIKPPIKKISELKHFYNFISGIKYEVEKGFQLKKDSIDLSNFIFNVLTKYSNRAENIVAKRVLKVIDSISQFTNYYPKSSALLNINTYDIKSYLSNELQNMDDSIFELIVDHLKTHEHIKKIYNEFPDFDFLQSKVAIEKLATNRMTQIIDKRLLDFIDMNRSTAQTLKMNIRKKKRFPRGEFEKLKDAFPCIIAGIRDYSEYIPLEPDLFDLLIIDEASQVSIAQAFPALLRAKKIIVLGDNKQFSNVKSALARTKTNKEYLNRLKKSFVNTLTQDPAQLERLTKFNIKTSILDFFGFISNYNALLKKHFRGYQEHISYSNKYFYNGQLQAIKLRNKPIDEIIKFKYLEPEENNLPYKNVNLNEVRYIIAELNRLKEQDTNLTVGIITPHTNQQKLLSREISILPDRDIYYDKLKLKIMTFDTCQGEERDIIYYSMVANKFDDKLWGVFIKDLHAQDLEEGGVIKAQRLNVGFSRVKEQMHFVLSKHENEFGGSIGEALRHYKTVLENAKKLPEKSDVDPKSPMEAKVIDWIKNTELYAKHFDKIELQAQFPIGKYLKQIDPYYNHPNFVADFLLLFKPNESVTHNVIIEYDGFFEHFKDYNKVNEMNFDQYYSADHVQREKILESYGYRFIRLNKFNTKKDPVSFLNQKLNNLFNNRSIMDNVESGKRAVKKTMKAIEDKKMKVCPKCKKLLSIENFHDSDLKTGVGRVCNDCKVKSSWWYY